MNAALVGISCIMGGCMTNNVALELIVKEDPGAGPLLTLLQFTFIVLVTFRSHVRFDSSVWYRVRINHKIPLWFYGLLTAIFFTLSVLNNIAFKYHISQPVHMVFRSSSLMVSFILGKLFFKKKYNMVQFIAVVMISLGILMALKAEADTHKAKSVNAMKENEFAEDTYATWLFGILILTIALTLSSVLGFIQDMGFNKWGKQTDEAMFMTHLFSLPMFISFGSELTSHLSIWSSSARAFGPVPWMWLYVLVNVVSQYVCIRGVYILMGAAGPLSVNLTLTARKFFSLMFSVYVFNNPFSMWHWAGAMLVFMGCLAYSQAPSPTPTPKTKV